MQLRENIPYSQLSTLFTFHFDNLAQNVQQS